MTTMMTLMPHKSFLLISFLLTATTARAQGTVRDAVGVLVTNRAVQTADVERDRAVAEAASDTIARALLTALTSAPIATSSGGFLYRLNPNLGTVERASESFGPFFVERALTAGQGSVSFGMTAATAPYTRLNGYGLGDGSLVTVANRFRDEPAPFDTESLTMHLRASTVTLFANVGVTDELDLGIALPMAQISFDGERLNVYRGSPLVQATASGTASGLADIAIRAKYAALTTRFGGVAVAGELRLPTGDDANLLGAGSPSWRLLGIASFDRGPVSVHANAGIVRGGISDETIVAGALSLSPSPRITVTLELLRRDVSAIGEFVLVNAPHPALSGVDTYWLMTSTDGSTLVTLIPGVKWNISDTLVLGAHLAWPRGDRGLSGSVVPTVSLEYSMR
jgi:hypothetical protein